MTRRGSRARPFRLRGVVFDFDGTLTVPGALDFALIKRQVGCPPDRLMLEFIEALPEGEQRASARAALELFELESAAGSHPNEGAEDLVRLLRAHDLRIGVLTRNGLAAVTRAFETFPALRADAFDVVVTRDDDVTPKPSPDGIRHIAQLMGIATRELLMVGDYVLDIEAGKAAGAVTVYLTNGDDDPGDHDADFVVHDLAELHQVVRLGLPLPSGKLPNDLLADHLATLSSGAGVLVGAGVGDDVAALDVAGADTIVVHGDPVTLATSRLGRYAVLVNANDIATSGGEPRWLFTTVLLPAGTTASEALALLEELADEAQAIGATVAGGHTEVTGAVSRPLVAATTIGVVRRAGLRDKRGAAPGDDVVLTKALAVEGTALLAQELGERLRALGMSGAELDDCAALLDQVSVLPEARVAVGFAGARALHDVTEGGLATALAELAVACHRRIVVSLDSVPVLPQTARLCGLLGADPLGLIASGSLLVTCRPNETTALLEALREHDLAAVVIGAVTAGEPGVTALRDGREVEWPVFARDEAARLLAE